ncbi:uncharacterized protein LOC131011386 isoform X3 [Salvia miltiorrhiza]|uniref:uncharacterized protein LOC131011386 isoform X3 n=1 Tax=Salvia miltiorrhiza TaxID=226208 RepID=UPI0025ABB40F|nr:uncharacterized protein LOC131011386 isoform X3 [Salvia miltiorrhiza]
MWAKTWANQIPQFWVKIHYTYSLLFLQQKKHLFHTQKHGAVIRLHATFLAKPEAVTDDCTDERWKWFKGCLGALDGTYVNVLVSNTDTPRYRTRKGEISTNVLAVCDRNGLFIYALSGWEGSASDSRILRDALSRPHGLKVPRGLRLAQKFHQTTQFAAAA